MGLKSVVDIWPINPSEDTDRHIAPSTALHVQSKVKDLASAGFPEESPSEGSPLFTQEQEALYQKRYEEQYYVDDPEFIAGLGINYPVVNVSETHSDTSSEKQESLHGIIFTVL